MTAPTWDRLIRDAETLGLSLIRYTTGPRREADLAREDRGRVSWRLTLESFGDDANERLRRAVADAIYAEQVQKAQRRNGGAA